MTIMPLTLVQYGNKCWGSELDIRLRLLVKHVAISDRLVVGLL